MALKGRSLTFRLPVEVYAAFATAYMDADGRGLGARLRYLVERDLRERARKRGLGADLAAVPADGAAGDIAS